MDHDDEAIFDDLYDDEPANGGTAAKPVAPAANQSAQPDSKPAPTMTNAPEPNPDNTDTDYTPAEPTHAIQSGVADYSGYDNMNQDYGYNQGQDYGNSDGNNFQQDMHNQMGSGGNGHYGQNMGDMHSHGSHGESGSTAIKEDGYMTPRPTAAGFEPTSDFFATLWRSLSTATEQVPAEDGMDSVTRSSTYKSLGYWAGRFQGTVFGRGSRQFGSGLLSRNHILVAGISSWTL
ncbi:hypothetical protein ABW21_db0201621 [Orbilia brochopaga]|nr:hypothetical protein ABW21_db0201621 [Drechslerella brochopaga]